MNMYTYMYIYRYFEKRRKKQKGLRDEDLDADSKIVEFHDLKGTTELCALVSTLCIHLSVSLC